jgi:hypothetical protein
MIVAVAAPFPPPQHSPMLGHLASSHTVCNPRPLKSFLIALYDAPVGIGCLRKEGKRGLHVSRWLSKRSAELAVKYCRGLHARSVALGQMRNHQRSIHRPAWESGELSMVLQDRSAIQQSRGIGRLGGSAQSAHTLDLVLNLTVETDDVVLVKIIVVRCVIRWRTKIARWGMVICVDQPGCPFSNFKIAFQDCSPPCLYTW